METKELNSCLGTSIITILIKKEYFLSGFVHKYV